MNDGKNARKREAAGGWLAGVAEAGANEPFFTPVDGWVVERGLPHLLSVSRTSGLLALSSLFSPPSRALPFHPFSLFLGLSSSLCSRLSLASVLFRARLSQPFYFAISFPRQRSFFPPLPTYMLAFPPYPPRQPRPCFASLYVRAFPASPASPALRSDRLRIHCEIDRPKRVPEWPERTRMQQKGMGWHMRSGRFKGTPQERDATAIRCIATPLSSFQFFLDFPSGTVLLFLFARYIPRTDSKVGSFNANIYL